MTTPKPISQINLITTQDSFSSISLSDKDFFSSISSFLSPKDLGRLRRVDKALKKCVDSVAREILGMLRDNHQIHLRCLGMWETIKSSTPTVNKVYLISSRILQICGQDNNTPVNCSSESFSDLTSKAGKKQEAKNHLELFQWIAEEFRLALPNELIAPGRKAGEAYFLDNPNALFEWMEENKNTLRSIQNIYLSDFKGTTLPKEFLDFFPNLKELHLYNCPQLTALPDGFLKDCTQLEKLHLYNCPQLTTLPDGFLDKCSQLERLDLCNNPALWSDPDDTKNGEEILRSLLINKVRFSLGRSPHAERIYYNLAAKRIQKVFRGYRVRKKLTAKKLASIHKKELLIRVYDVINSVMLIALSYMMASQYSIFNLDQEKRIDLIN